MTLSDAIAEAQAYTASPPPNESTTCYWIIDPALWAMGYARHEIHPQIADNNGQYPDYCILPHTNFTWFLEAKAWSVKLEDKHAQQSLNYANQNGKRWVVLSNGREWRLYDNLVQGVAADKLVTSAMLSNPDQLSAFFGALSKDSVVSGGLVKFANDVRLSQFLKDQLQDENSETIRAIWAVVKRQKGLNETSRSSITALLNTGPGVNIAPTADPAPIDSAEEPTAAQAESDVLNLKALYSDPGSYVTGKHPSTIKFPDGQQVSALYWSALTKEIIAWLAKDGRLPALPYKGRPSGKTYFLNMQPNHPAGPMKQAVQIESHNGPIYVDVNRSGAELVMRLCEVCEAAGVSPSEIEVTIR